MQLTLLAAALLPALVTAQGDIGALLQSQPNLSTLLSLVQLANLTSTLSSASNITILAPTNDAFAKVDRNVPEGVAIENRNATSVAALLSNHVFKGYYPSSSISEVPTFAQTLLTPEFENDIQPFTDIPGGQYNGIVKNGNGVSVTSGEFTVSNVVQAKDIRVGNGIVIHVIDTVLSFGPPLQLFTARDGLSTFNAAFGQFGPDLATGLTEPSGAPRNSSELTVFVPTNDVFNLIGSIINGADPATLHAVLSYHVIQNNIIFSPSISNTSVVSLQGAPLNFTVLPNGSVFVNGAKVIVPNVILSQGVVHIIDNVLSPLQPSINRASYSFGAPASARTAFASATPVSLSLPVATFTEAVTERYSIPALFTTGRAVAVSTTTTARTTAVTQPPSQYTGAAAALVAPGMMVAGVAAGAFLL